MTTLRKTNHLSVAELNQVMAIWLAENLAAHPFIARQHWLDNFQTVKEQLPAATLYLAKTDGTVHGFLGIIEPDYIAGLFVANNSQGQGIGKQLLSAVKQDYPKLQLTVYAKNQKAFNFYQKQNFKIVQEQIDAQTGEAEYVLTWSRT